MRSRYAGWALGFLLTAVLLSPGMVWFGCGGGGGDGAGSSSAITGTWDLVVFRNGGNAGWEHVTGTFDGSGNLTSFSNYVDSDGSVDPGGTPDTPLKWTFDSNGGIIETDNNVSTFFQ